MCYFCKVTLVQPGMIPRERLCRIVDGTWVDYIDHNNQFQHHRVLTMEHVIPLSHGGQSTLENLVPCCPQCNAERNRKTVRGEIA